MLRIKRLYIYILQTFVPVFFMTFAICLFIILMQFVWKYVEDFVGKGLETHILAELFTYAALTLVPMALPLAILLASLMAFGNLGERYELLAIKAAGISLLKAMRPLIVLIALISFGAFLFQNDVIPKVQVKFRTLMISIKQTSPELDIPENTFYSGINNYNLFIKSKNKENGRIFYDVIIYDTSKGFDNLAVIVCDSAHMKMAASKEYVILSLYYGQQFSNFQQSGLGGSNNFRNNKFVPYSRENFKEKEIIIAFDTNFSRIDDSAFQGTQLSKNTSELRASIDSLGIIIDSLNINDRKTVLNRTYLLHRNQKSNLPPKTAKDSAKSTVEEKPLIASIDFDSVMLSLTAQERLNVYNDAQMKSENNKNDYMFRSLAKVDAQKKLRQHDVELQRKYTLSFACLIFFFIGAPLGAIIRKGGLGMPVVISVILFIVYYIIDNVGYKMARDGVWPVWQGVWLSSFVLFPLGVFITYKAINDSALFNPEAYGKYFRSIFFIKISSKSDDKERNAILDRIPDISQIELEANTLKGMELMDSDNLREIIHGKDEHNYDKNTKLGALSLLKKRGADINAIIDRQNDTNAKENLSLFTGSAKLTAVAYVLFILFFILKVGFLSTLIDIAYIALFIRSIVYYFNFYGKINRKEKVYHTVISILLFVLFPVAYIPVRKHMEKQLSNIRIIP